RRDTVESQERSFAAAGHARFDAAVPLRADGAAAGAAMAGLVRRSLEPGLARHGAVREASRHIGAATRHRPDRAGLRARLCRFPLCRLRLAQGLPEARRLPSEDAGTALGQGLATAGGIAAQS